MKPEELEAQRRGIVETANIKGDRHCRPLPHPYVSIDIETTGLDPEVCQVIEFGAVLEDWITPIEQLPRFHRYVVHDRIIGEPFALAMNAEILRRIANREEGYLYATPAQLAAEFDIWLQMNQVIKEPSQAFTAAGKNFASFDLQFLRRIPAFKHIKIHHRSIDPAMLYWRPETDIGLPSSKTCKDRAGVPGDVIHTAIEDAIDVIQTVRAAYPIVKRTIAETPGGGYYHPVYGPPYLANGRTENVDYDND